ncbi:hypothetical protein [uncultured Roseobacter sp.]|uniref:hypothetical protein n=1 Tax=uncultured Roseobacter sp. TaxID=114847 RepID=UPI00262EAB66|nr:hypothetical protein [uncultured Roseobacter sp.]
MRHAIYLLRTAALAGALVACTPLTVYHRQGTAVATMRADLLACEVSALADVPVANQIRREPPRYIPARRFCDADGDCVTRGGFFEEGRVFTVDVNADLRDRVEAQCMADEGYVPQTLPNCPNSVFRAVPKTQTAVLPRLTPNTCAIKYQDGTWQIVEQAG